MSDTRIVGGDQNHTPITALTVRPLKADQTANAIPVFLVNVSGDAYNAGGGSGAGSNVNINQINGQTPDMNAGNVGAGTLRVVLASDQPTVSISGNLTATTSPPPVTGVQVVGGSVGGRFSMSGDQLAVLQQGAWAVAITGDVLLRANGPTLPVSVTTPIGVQVVGGAVGGKFSASGDLSVIPSTTNFNKFPTSGDTRLMDGSDNTIKATVKNYGNSRPLAVVLVNVSGDVYNALGSGGASSSVNLTQIAGTATSVGSGTTDAGTLRVVIASDQTVPISGNLSVTVPPPPVTGVQIVGGGTNRVSISGDQLGVFQQGAWAVAGTGDFSTTPKAGNTWPVREQGVIGVQVVGGGTQRVSISGDTLLVNQQGAWAVAVTGDVLLRAGGPTIPVSFAGPLGVQVVGGAVGGAVQVTGDVLLRANPNVIIGQIGNTVGVNVIGGSIGGRFSASGDLTVREQAVTGVQIVGGSVGAQISASGDLAVKPQAGLTKFPVSGDQRIIDGSDPTIKATVKSYTRSNPQAVVLVNVSGDVYNSAIDQPIAIALAGRLTGAGSNTVVSAVAGKKIKVFSYSLQADGDNARGFFASGASGSQLTLEWELASREGIAKQIGAENSQCLFATTAGALLSFEMSSSKPMKYEISYHAEDSL